MCIWPHSTVKHSPTPTSNTLRHERNIPRCIQLVDARLEYFIIALDLHFVVFVQFVAPVFRCAITLVLFNRQLDAVVLVGACVINPLGTPSVSRSAIQRQHLVVAVAPQDADLLHIGCFPTRLDVDGHQPNADGGGSGRLADRRTEHVGRRVHMRGHAGWRDDDRRVLWWCVGVVGGVPLAGVVGIGGVLCGCSCITTLTTLVMAVGWWGYGCAREVHEARCKYVQ